VVAREATARGWAVRGFARPNSTIPTQLSQLPIVRGDFADVTRVAETVAAADAVCVVIGPRPPYTDVFCAAATERVVFAMREAGVRRLVCQTGAIIGPGNRTRVFGWMARTYAQRRPAAARDRIDQERLVQESGLDWTIVKPPRLTDSAGGHDVTAGPALRVGLISSISRVDLAAFVLDAIDRADCIGVRFFVRQR